MTRQIAISEEAYERLARLKDNKKSFTKVILELTDKSRGDISDLFGAWKISDAAAERLKSDIKRARKNFLDKGYFKGKSQ
jgi:predicted CopG family antitoxin